MGSDSSMQVADLLPDCSGSSVGSVEVSSLAYDSRKVLSGGLFFCVPGFNTDGHDFAPAAVDAGANALVVERELTLDCPQVVVSSVRESMAICADRFYGKPSSSLDVFGITGTNGKTTVSSLIRSLLESLGTQCGLIGTVKSVAGGVESDSVRTTPESIDLQQEFRRMLDLGDRACSIEVSSHALSLNRVDCTRFKAAVFTNLTQDHLDFHGGMEEYYLAKRKLFELSTEERVINIDDQYGRRLYADFPDAATVSLTTDANYQAVDIKSTVEGTEFLLKVDGSEVLVKTPLFGKFNVYNMLCAVAALHRSGFELEAVAGGAAKVEPVPGRLQPVSEGQPFAVFVDYAHTPDSLKNVLETARELTTGRVISLFGCGGDRDRDKRAKMGAVSQQHADYTVVTSDNPRSEDPESIIQEIVTGFSSPTGQEMDQETDRREAIAKALTAAQAGDTVVVAGKGHEQGQEFANGEKVPFDDVQEVKAALKNLGLGKP